MILNLKNYKNAKLYKTDLEEILREVDTAITRFQKYARYRPVSEILAELKDNRIILKSHLDKCLKIIDTKGKQGE